MSTFVFFFFGDARAHKRSLASQAEIVEQHQLVRAYQAETARMRDETSNMTAVVGALCVSFDRLSRELNRRRLSDGRAPERRQGRRDQADAARSEGKGKSTQRQNERRC